MSKVTLKSLDERLKKLEEQFESSLPNRYKFETIFDYDDRNRILIPKYDISISGKRYNKGVAITRPKQRGFFGGTFYWDDAELFFSRFGKDLIGHWYKGENYLEITGFGY